MSSTHNTNRLPGTLFVVYIANDGTMCYDKPTLDFMCMLALSKKVRKYTLVRATNGISAIGKAEIIFKKYTGNFERFCQRTDEPISLTSIIHRFRKEKILECIHRNNCNVTNIAKELNINRKTVYRWFAGYNIDITQEKIKNGKKPYGSNRTSSANSICATSSSNRNVA